MNLKQKKLGPTPRRLTLSKRRNFQLSYFCRRYFVSSSIDSESAKKKNIVTLVIRYMNFCEHHIPCGELSVEVNNFKGSKDPFPRLIKFMFGSKANE